ncbi:hypothetical protein K445DRAFT_363673 [Daldinia sp. EC12]|nr:hypothetical protein K445DRAFT_363673 [Daldinia sp. EC12]
MPIPVATTTNATLTDRGEASGPVLSQANADDDHDCINCFSVTSSSQSSRTSMHRAPRDKIRRDRERRLAEIECGNCGKMGHEQRSCPESCGACGAKTHKLAACAR